VRPISREQVRVVAEATHGDVVVILSEFVGTGNEFPLLDPLLQIIYFSVEHEELQRLVQLGPPLAGQILQSGVQLVYLRLFHGDLVATTS